MSRRVHWPVFIALFVLLSVALTDGIYTATDTGEAWESTAVLYVWPTHSPELYPTTAAKAPDEDYPALVLQTAVLAPVIPQLHRRFTVEEVRGILEVTWKKETSQIKIEGRSGYQYTTQWMVQLTAESFKEWYRTNCIERAERSLAKTEEAIAVIEGREGLTDSQAWWLGQLMAMRVAWTGELERLSATDPVIIQSRASEPVLLLGRHTWRNIGLAGGGSLVLGIAVAVLVERWRRKGRFNKPRRAVANEELDFVEAMRTRLLADRDKSPRRRRR